MRELILLLKTHFANTYNINKLFTSKKSKLILYALLAIYIVFSLIATSFSYAQLTASYLNKYQMISLMLILFFVVSAFAAFMFTIYNAKNNMFSAEDNDLLLSMPIKANIILASRIISITLWNLITSAFIMIPAFVVYAMNVSVPFTYYLYAFIVFLLLPVVPTILASIIGYIIAYLTSKSNIKNWFEIIMSLVTLGTIYYGISQMNAILSFMVNNVADFENIIKWGFYPVYLVEQIFSDYNVLSLLLYIVFNIGLFIVFTYILSVNFKKIIAKLQENRTKSNYVMKTLTTESIGKVLFKKELKRYLSSPIYVLNTFFGIIMLVVAAIATIFYNQEQILLAMGVNGGFDTFQLLAAAVVFITFLSNTTSASISLEGKNYWILKTLPIPSSRIFNGKLLLNVVLVLPIVLFSLLVLKFTLNISVIEVAILGVLATLSTLVSSKFGLLVNLKFPKMDAINDTVIVKRSASVMICVLLPMALTFGVASLYSAIGSSIDFNIFIMVIIIIFIVLNIVERILLNTWGSRRFKEIN